MEDKFNWGEEQFDALHYFTENLSGNWHPAEWGVIINFLSKIKLWDGRKDSQVGIRLDQPTREQLHVTRYMQLFITALFEAEFFEDENDLFEFLKFSTSDDSFAVFRNWVSREMPLTSEDEGWFDWLEDVDGFVDNRDDNRRNRYYEDEAKYDMEEIEHFANTHKSDKLGEEE